MFSKIGSGSFIPGFEEQIIGHMPGETVNVEVTFPVPYPNNPDLAGKDALFVTEINYITEYADPEFTDDFVKENLYGTYGLSTVAEVREYIENSIREQDVREFHAMINAVAAEHLGAIQVLGYVLGFVIGLFQVVAGFR